MEEPPSGFLGLQIVDLLVVVGYLVGITVIGTWSIRKVKSSTSFFISDRKSGKLMMMFFNFGTGTHSDQAVSVAAKTFRAGASGIWYQWLWLFCTPLYWLIAPMFRRMRAVTTSDYFEARFDKSVAVLYAVVAVLQMTVNIGVMLKGSSAMITAVSGGTINATWAIFAMTVMFVIYGVAGGLSAAIVTDLVQGILTIVLSFMILPFALAAVGWMPGLREAITGPLINRPEMLSLVAPGEITYFFITVVTLNALIGYGTQPHTMALCAAGKTEMEARVGMTCGMFIKRLCTVAWVLTGLCAAVIYVKQSGDAEFDVDHVYGLMARDLLPDIAPGLVGLFIASMLAAVMSSCDAFMVSCSALFTENVYRKLIVRNAGDRHYVLVGRCASVLVVVAGIYFAFSLESVVHGLEIFWKISAMMGLAFWAGLFWRRTTVAGAWIGTLAGFVAFLFTSQIKMFGRIFWDFNARFADHLPECTLKQIERLPKEAFDKLDKLSQLPDALRAELQKLPELSQALLARLDQLPALPEPLREEIHGLSWRALSLPSQMIIYLGVGLAGLVVVSLLTSPVSREQLDRFYVCLRTPVEPDEPETEPFTLPPGVEPAPRRVLVDLPGFEIPMPSLLGVAGVLATCVAVVALIVGVYGIFLL